MIPLKPAISSSTPGIGDLRVDNSVDPYELHYDLDHCHHILQKRGALYGKWPTWSEHYQSLNGALHFGIGKVQ
jgi:hypothetical protein